MSIIIVKIPWDTITFLYNNMFTLHVGETMRKIPSFAKLLLFAIFVIFKLMELCKKILIMSVSLHNKLLMQHMVLPSRISEIETIKVCSSFLLLNLFFDNNKLYNNSNAEFDKKVRLKTFRRWENLKEKKETTMMYIF